MENEEKKALLESVLFVSGTSLSTKELQRITELSSGEITFLLSELMAEYRNRGRGIQIVEVAEGYQMVSNPAYSGWIRRLKTNLPLKLSMAALETLAIIAYRQPISKAEIEELRGVNSEGTLKSLTERRFVRIVGRKETPGRPLLYGTTREFLQHFGLKDLSELPTARELNPDEL